MQYFSIKEPPIEAALDYASRGIPVFPAHVRADEKQERGVVYPLIHQGIKDATTDVSKICTMWTNFPKALVGIPTGSATGLLVIHVCNSGVQNWEHLANKESFDPYETLSIPTPWGRYYFYQYPILQNRTLGCTSNILDGIDAIGEGGAAVLPPLDFWKVSKTPSKIFKIGGINFRHEETNVQEIKITDYDITKQVDPFPNGLITYLQDFVSDDADDTNTQKQTIHKSSRVGSQILFSVCDKIKKINTRNGCDRDIGAEYERYVEKVASFVAGGEINENEAISAINTAVRASEELIFECNLRYTQEGWIKGFQEPKTSTDYYKEREKKEKQSKEDVQIDQNIDENCEKFKLPELPMECLHEDVQALIRRICASVNCDTWMPFAVLLKAVATCVGANVLLEHSAFTNPTHQWIVLVCESGTGKSAVNEYISRPIIRAQSILYEQYCEDMKVYTREKMEWEARVKAKMKDKGSPEPGDEPKKPVSVEYYVDDITPESLVGTLMQNPSGVVWDTDEFAAWIRSFGRYAKSGGGDPAKSRILGMYDGHTISYKRVKNGGITDQVKKAWLSVFGTVQPNILPKLMTAEDFDSGFLQRFLFICSEPPPPAPLQGRPKLEDQDALVDKIIGPMLGWKRLEVRGFREEPDKPVRAYLQSESEFYLNDFFENMQQNYYHGGDEFARTRARRWQAQCVRLILALHCLDRALSGAPDGGGVVKESTVENGVCIFKCLMEHASCSEKLMRNKKANTVHKTDYKILAYIDDMIEHEKNCAVFYYTNTNSKGIKNIDTLKTRFENDKIILTSQKISKKLEGIGFEKQKITSGVRMSMPMAGYKQLIAIALKPEQSMDENHVKDDPNINMQQELLDVAVKLAEENNRLEIERVQERLAAISPRYKKGA